MSYFSYLRFSGQIDSIPITILRATSAWYFSIKQTFGMLLMLLLLKNHKNATVLNEAPVKSFGWTLQGTALAALSNEGGL